MSNQENFYLDEVISGERKIEYVDKLELLREKVNSKGVLSSRSSKKELIEIVENLIDLMPVELRTARWLVREQDTYLNKAREEANEILSIVHSTTKLALLCKKKSRKFTCFCNEYAIRCNQPRIYDMKSNSTDIS